LPIQAVRMLEMAEQLSDLFMGAAATIVFIGYPLTLCCIEATAF